MNADRGRRKERLMKSLKHKMPRCFLVVGLALLMLLGVVGLVSCGDKNEMVSLLFRNDLLAVRVDGLWGYANSRGRLVIEPRFEEAEWQFNSMGTAVVKEDGLWGFIDRRGNYTSQERYQIQPSHVFGDVYQIRSSAGEIFMDHKGRVLWEGDYEPISFFDDFRYCTVQTDGKRGVMDRSGRYIIEPLYEDVYYYAEEKVALVVIDGKYGLMDLEGNMLIEPCFDGVVSSSLPKWAAYKFAEGFDENGLLFVYKNELCVCGGYNHRYGAVNAKGEIVYEPIYQTEIEKMEGSDLYILNTKSGYVIGDAEGNILPEPTFGYLDSSVDACGLRRAQRGGKVGYVDETLQFVIEPVFDSASSFGEDDFTYFAVDKKYGYIDRTGKVVIEPKFDRVWNFESCDMAIVRVDGKEGCIDRSGNYVVEPLYDSVRIFASPGMFAVRKDGKCEIIDREGKTVFGPVENSSVSSISGVGNYCIVNLKGRYWLIDEDGDYEFYSYLSRLEKTDLICVGEFEKYGVMSGDGREILPAEYDEIYGCLGDMILARKGNMVCFVDLTGNIVEEREYHSVFLLAEGQYVFLSGAAGTDILDREGNVLVTLPGELPMDRIRRAYDLMK